MDMVLATGWCTDVEALHATPLPGPHRQQLILP